jgi:hypothetical protein
MASDTHKTVVAERGSVRFLREQDGPVEREFKAAIRAELSTSLRKAFLLVVDYGPGSPQGVAVCFLSLESEEATADAIGRVFSRIFNRDQHLDIIALRPSQVEHVEAIAKPFISMAS